MPRREFSPSPATIDLAALDGLVAGATADERDEQPDLLARRQDRFHLRPEALRRLGEAEVARAMTCGQRRRRRRVAADVDLGPASLAEEWRPGRTPST